MADLYAPELGGTHPYDAGRSAGLRTAYEAARRIVDRDAEDGVDDFGIIDNLLAELAKLAGIVS